MSATLPNLNPDVAGHCAFYNVIEQSGLDQQLVTWSDVVDNTNINSYTSYDNGVILKYDDDAWGDLTIRCKTDGWVVAYTGWDGSLSGAASGVGIGERFSHGNLPSLTSNRLVQAMEDIMTDLSDWNLGNGLSHSDIGLYDFAYASHAISLFGEDTTASGTRTFEINESTNTSVNVAHAGGKATAGYNYDWGGHVTAYFKIEGDSVASAGSGSDIGYYDFTTAVETSETTSMEIKAPSSGENGSVTAVATVYWDEA